MPHATKWNTLSLFDKHIHQTQLINAKCVSIKRRDTLSVVHLISSITLHFTVIQFSNVVNLACKTLITCRNV